MRNILLHLFAQFALLRDESGQDLIEYGLLVALVAFAATAGMTTLASAINVAFTNIGGTLNTYIT